MRRGWKRALLIVAGGALATVLRRTTRFAVEGESMTPTLRPGDYLLVGALPQAWSRRWQAPRPGWIVVARSPRPEGDGAGPRREIVKRVGARAGDRLTLLGDNPEQSTDSRQFGPVPAEAVLGVVWWRYWPPRRFGPLA